MMEEAPRTLPEQYRYRYLSASEADRYVGYRGFEKLTAIETKLFFVSEDRGEWFEQDCFLLGDPKGAIPVAEVKFTFADGRYLDVITGHELDEALGIAYRVAAKGNEAGACLHEIRGAIDTTFLDLTEIEDFRVNLKPEVHGVPLYKLDYRSRQKPHFDVRRPLRFLRESDRDALMQNIAACAGGKDGFVRLDAHAQIPQAVMPDMYDDVHALYLKPSTLLAVLATQAYNVDTSSYIKDSAELWLLYGPNYWIALQYGDDIAQAKLSARRLLKLNPRLREVDGKKSTYVDLLRFSHASTSLSADTATGADAPTNQIFLHFKDHACPAKITLPSAHEARRFVDIVNDNARKAKKPRLMGPQTKGGNNIRVLFPD
jgi:hypothetical protein